MKKILPPTLVLICLIGMLILNWTLPLASISTIGIVVLGLGFVSLGIVISFAADGQFRRIHTTVHTFGIPVKLVTDGWFKYTRNPMYLSFASMLTGVWLLLGTLSPILGVLAFIFVTDRWYITHEEVRLAEIFGKEYESYQNRTRRWL